MTALAEDGSGDAEVSWEANLTHPSTMMGRGDSFAGLRRRDPLKQLPHNASPSPASQQPLTSSARRVAPAPRKHKPIQAVPKPLFTSAAAAPSTEANGKGRGYNVFTPAKLEAFVVVAEEGGLSAASRRLHVSQPALSQTINALERQLGVKLLVRSSTGVQMTQPGLVLLAEARAILARHDQLLRTMAGCNAEGGGGVIRLGIPLMLAPEVLRTIAQFAAGHPSTRLHPAHQVSMTAQLDDLRSGQLDVGFLRERPVGPEFDAMLVARENLGVLLGADLAARLAGTDGVRLDALGGLQWFSGPRSSSPRWHDELAAILRSHGLDLGSAASADHFPIPSVMLAAVSAGHAFALVPQRCAEPCPETVAWSPIAGHSVVGRTWAVWLANSRGRDVAQLIAAFEEPDGA